MILYMSVYSGKKREKDETCLNKLFLAIQSVFNSKKKKKFIFSLSQLFTRCIHANAAFSKVAQLQKRSEYP